MTSKLKLYRNHVVNSNVYPLGNDKGIQNINGTNQILSPCTALFVITFDTSINKYKVLLARKCKVGERWEVGHRDRSNQPVPYHRGAAGTKKKYWGLWVSIGGTNDSSATSSYDAAIKEFDDETASNKGDGANYLTFLHQDISSGTCIYIAYYPYQNSGKLIAKTNRQLIYSSHGEIAQLKWHIIGENLDNVANYVETSYINILLPYIGNLGTQLTELIKKCNGHLTLPLAPLANLVSTQTNTSGISVPTSVTNPLFTASYFDGHHVWKAITPTGKINYLSPDQMKGFGAAMFSPRHNINIWNLHNDYTNAYYYPIQNPIMKFYRSKNNNYYIEVFLSGSRVWSKKWLINVHQNNPTYTAI